MSFGSVGMFWEELPKKGRLKAGLPLPPVPETGWLPPTELPNLSAAKVISFDVETYDPELAKQPNAPARGPGWSRDSGHIVGFSVGVDRGGRWYFPIRHTVQTEHNLDPDQALKWLGTVLGDDRPKVGANLIYDVGWCLEEGVKVGGPLFDVQFAEALLNSEAPDVSLDKLAAKYLGENKVSDELYLWASRAYGGNATAAQRKEIYRCPPTLVGPYGESDADLPLRIMEKQWPLLAADGLLDLFNMECGLIPLLIEMRYAGTPIDLDHAEKLRSEMLQEMAMLSDEMRRITGVSVNTNASSDLAKAFDELGLWYPRTAPTQNHPQGQPSFTKDFLETVDHEFAEYVLQHRERGKMVSTFIESYLLQSHVNGVVHGQFHPLKGETNGTRSGRLAASTPNLQNIPQRTVLGKRIREAFVAEKEHLWRKYDYSQIEYRMLAHHAVGEGSDEIRARYNRDPDTDYHEAIITLIREMVAVELERSPAKTINFGLIYGMSKKELIRRLKLSTIAGEQLFNHYHAAVPFARATMEAASDQAERLGYVDTILGRRSHFDRWGPSWWDPDAPALSFDAALRAYGSVQRAFLHKALNRRLQGGAADIMKKAMYECYTQGVFADTGVPRLTVHDELDFIDPGGKQEAFREVAHIMENCVTTRVPIKVDLEVGLNWGQVKDVEKMLDDPYCSRFLR